MPQKSLLGFAACIGLLVSIPARAADPADTVPAMTGWERTFSVELVYATRANASNTNILLNTGTGDPILTSNDLGFGWAPGIDARATFDTGPHDIAVRFLGAFSWTGNASLTSPALWTIPTNPNLFGTGVAAITARSQSALNSLELNAVRPANDRAILFAGLRALFFDDSIGIAADFGANQAQIDITANTFGIGPQIGGEVRFGDDHFINLDGRAGLLLTHSQLDFDENQNTGPLFSSSSSEWGWAGIVEGGIAGGIRVHDTSAIKVGYRGIYIFNMPTAATSIAATNINGFAGTIGRTGEGVFVHAGTIGFEGHF